MKSFTVYNVSTGSIDYTLSQRNPPELPDGKAYLEGNFPDNLFKIENGVAVPIQDKNAGIGEIDPWILLRFSRNKKLGATDWTQVADTPVDQAAWKAYRQALRDLPANTTDPENPDWPVPPSA